MTAKLGRAGGGASNSCSERLRACRDHRKTRPRQASQSGAGLGGWAARLQLWKRTKMLGALAQLERDTSRRTVRTAALARAAKPGRLSGLLSHMLCFLTRVPSWGGLSLVNEKESLLGVLSRPWVQGGAEGRFRHSFEVVTGLRDTQPLADLFVLIAAGERPKV